MNVLKRSLPERIWRRLGRHPVLVVSTVSLGVRVAKDGALLRHGEIDGTEFRARTGRHLGSMSGGLAGAAAGAAWGSVLPGLGTAIGALAGSLIGEELGGRVGRLAVEQAEVTWRERSAPAPEPTVEPDVSPPKSVPPKRQL